MLYFEKKGKEFKENVDLAGQAIQALGVALSIPVWEPFKNRPQILRAFYS